MGVDKMCCVLSSEVGGVVREVWDAGLEQCLGVVGARDRRSRLAGGRGVSGTVPRVGLLELQLAGQGRCSSSGSASANNT